jgi:hypothetical protein
MPGWRDMQNALQHMTGSSPGSLPYDPCEQECARCHQGNCTMQISHNDMAGHRSNKNQKRADGTEIPGCGHRWNADGTW